MGRERRDFIRRNGFRDGALFVIAAEGAVTEPTYFSGLKERWHHPRIHIEVVTRPESGQSSPASVIRSLDQHAATYRLQDGDQLWLVIDRDSKSWKPREMAEVARVCQQKKYFLAVSNPCFELWLLLHFEDLPSQSPERKQRVLENNGEFLKREVSRRLATKAEYIDHFVPHTDHAIARSKMLDSKPGDRWPSGLGTRVYRLVEQLQPKTG